MRVVTQLALANPRRARAAAASGRVLLNAPAASTLRDRMGALYGFGLAARLLDVAGEAGSARIVGVVAPPALARSHRDDMHLIVNGRVVRDTLLTQALIEAYRPLLPRDQFPVAALALDAGPARYRRQRAPQQGVGAASGGRAPCRRSPPRERPHGAAPPGGRPRGPRRRVAGEMSPAPSCGRARVSGMDGVRPASRRAWAARPRCFSEAGALYRVRPLLRAGGRPDRGHVHRRAHARGGVLRRPARRARARPLRAPPGGAGDGRPGVAGAALPGAPRAVAIASSARSRGPRETLTRLGFGWKASAADASCCGRCRRCCGPRTSRGSPTSSRGADEDGRAGRLARARPPAGLRRVPGGDQLAVPLIAARHATWRRSRTEAPGPASSSSSRASSSGLGQAGHVLGPEERAPLAGARRRRRIPPARTRGARARSSARRRAGADLEGQREQGSSSATRGRPPRRSARRRSKRTRSCATCWAWRRRRPRRACGPR